MTTEAAFSRLFPGMFKAHRSFFARTILVKDGNTLEAMKLLNKLMASERLSEIYRRTRYYEKPFLQRNRMSYERVKAIYDEDMQRKIQFVMRKNRPEPFPGLF